MKNRFSKILAAILTICMIASFCTVPMVTSAETNDLKFNANGKFKIVVFSDTQDHYVITPRLTNIMAQAIDREDPDLIVFLGDQTEQNYKDADADVKRTLNALLAPVVDADVPYAIVFGNHDNQSSISGTRTDKDAMLRAYQSVGDCRTTDPAPSIYGTGTCNIPIYSSDGSNIAFNLWMIDSNTYKDPITGNGGYDNPHADQLAWLQEKQGELTAQEGHVVPSVAFQHIPVPEMVNLFVEDANGSVAYNGKKYNIELIPGVTGAAGEFPHGANPADAGEYEVLKQMGVSTLFTGHDHLNDFSGKFEDDGVTLTAVPGMTYCNYGDEAVRGYGVIELDENDLPDYGYHSVKFSTLDAEAGAPTEITYDTYDEINYSDLKLNGTPVGDSTQIGGGGRDLFTYDATSPTHSVVLKFRWTVGSKPSIQFSFDHRVNAKGDVEMSYPFGVWVKQPNVEGAGANGAWHLKPDSSTSTLANMSAPLKQGDKVDIELGRKKVLTGPSAYVGTYYVYLKVNGELVMDGYTAVDSNGVYTSASTDCQLADEFFIADWSGAGNVFSNIPVVENYEAYDEIGFEDLIYDGTPVGNSVIDGGHNYTYNVTSPTHSVKLSYRWTAGGDALKFTTFMDDYVYPFCFTVKTPNQDDFGKKAGPNGAWHLVPSNGDLLVDMDTPIVAGNTYDIEQGRLKVVNGPNAGKYYVYVKINDELIQSYYYDGVAANGTYGEGTELGNLLFISASAGNKFSAVPVKEVYDEYDELTVTDLIRNNQFATGEVNINGGNAFTYNRTSSSYSAILKYRWIVGEEAKFQMSFDMDGEGMSYPCGIWVKGPNDSGAGENGAVWFRPGIGQQVDFDHALTEGETVDFEIGRLKVLNGPNAGKYYLYLKMDGVLIDQGYMEITDGTYLSGANTVQLSNTVLFADWGGKNNKIAAVEIDDDDPEDSIYYPYDEISYNSLFLNGQPLASETNLTGQTIFTYNRTSPTYSTVFKFRWTAGSVAKFSLFFDQSGAYPFTLCAKYPNQDNFGTVPGDNGAWQVNVTLPETLVNLENALVPGQSYDIEFGRLKVKKGENAGKYYVYLKVDDEDIVGYYYGDVSADGSYYNGCQLSNNIVFEVWGTENTKISASPIKEQYDAYDELNFTDLYLGGQPVTGEITLNGGQTYTYNRTSPSYSAILHFKWKAGDVAKFQMSFDQTENGSISYPFGIWVKEPNGDGAGANGAYWFMPGQAQGVQNDFDHPLTAGEEIEFEMGRLKVITGPNAGKYYTYLKMDNELIASAYNEVGANGQYSFSSNTISLSNEIRFGYWTSAVANNLGKLAPVEIPTVYEPYDVINYADLLQDGSPVGTETAQAGASVLTYNKTSPTGSAIFKYRWTVGSVPKVQFSFDKVAADTMDYLFGVQIDVPSTTYPNGDFWLRPGYGPHIDLPFALVPGSSHNMEIARLKIKSGNNAGKYYVYVKIDDQLIAEDYVDGSLIVNNQYTSEPFGTTCSISNELLFAYWGSDGNKIAPYYEKGAHLGTCGDFNQNGTLDAADIAGLKQLILGALSLDAAMGDYNADGVTDVRDLVAMKKDMAKANIHTRTGALALGMQEHINEDGTGVNETKTPAYIADATATMGATCYRMNRPLNGLFWVNDSNQVFWNQEGKAVLDEMINQLKAKGIHEILHVSDAFLEPANYVFTKDAEQNVTFIGHNITIPDPVTEYDTYLTWLNINAEAYRMLAEAYPEIKYFEPYNEPNITTSRMEKLGVAWSKPDGEQYTDAELAPYKFTVKEKAGIMADLCWYVSRAVKSVDPANQVTTPAISYDSVGAVQKNFVEELYRCIESGNYPTGQNIADSRVDNYFTILSVHTYPDYQNKLTGISTTEFAGELNEFYNIVKAHGDGDSRIWLTETGVSDNGTRNKNYVAANMKAVLTAIDTQLTYIDAVFVYKLANVSEDNGWSSQETNYGIFYSGDDLDNPYEAKPIAKTVYSYFHNNTTDYSALNALVNRWK